MIEPREAPSPAQMEALLRPLAAQLIWWQSPDEALRNPDRVIAQVMNLGEFEDVMRL